MTVEEKIEELCGGGIHVVNYGNGVISHCVCVMDGDPTIVEIGLKSDCRGRKIEADDINCIIQAIPFRDRNVLECFKVSLAKIEQYMDEKENKTGE